MIEYAEHTRPLKAYYETRNLLRPIDAGRPPEEVFEHICHASGMDRVQANEAA